MQHRASGDIVDINALIVSGRILWLTHKNKNFKVHLFLSLTYDLSDLWNWNIARPTNVRCQIFCL